MNIKHTDIFQILLEINIKTLKKLFKSPHFMFYQILPIIKLKFAKFNHVNLLLYNLVRESHSFGKIKLNPNKSKYPH